MHIGYYLEEKQVEQVLLHRGHRLSLTLFVLLGRGILATDDHPLAQEQEKVLNYRCWLEEEKETQEHDVVVGVNVVESHHHRPVSAPSIFKYEYEKWKRKDGSGLKENHNHKSVPRYAVARQQLVIHLNKSSYQRRSLHLLYLSLRNLIISILRIFIKAVLGGFFLHLLWKLIIGEYFKGIDADFDKAEKKSLISLYETLITLLSYGNIQFAYGIESSFYYPEII